MRKLVQDLRALGDVSAPATLRPAVLAVVGLGDSYACFDTPIGQCFVAFNDKGIAAVTPAASADDFERAFQARFGRSVRRVAGPPDWLRRVMGQWTHGHVRESLRFDLRGLTEFEREVLLKAAEIPWGEVRPYSWVAREIGKPRAVRAVGTALGHNPIPLLIPCHRVVRRDGSTGNYGFGPAAKRAVLAAEGVDPDALDALARSGVRYYGSDTTHIFCLPSCRYARRMTDTHRVSFHSDVEAAAAGYRPCKVCRPA